MRIDFLQARAHHRMSAVPTAEKPFGSLGNEDSLADASVPYSLARTAQSLMLTQGVPVMNSSSSQEPGSF